MEEESPAPPLRTVDWLYNASSVHDAWVTMDLPSVNVRVGKSEALATNPYFIYHKDHLLPSQNNAEVEAPPPTDAGCRQESEQDTTPATASTSQNGSSHSATTPRLPSSRHPSSIATRRVVSGRTFRPREASHGASSAEDASAGEKSDSEKASSEKASRARNIGANKVRPSIGGVYQHITVTVDEDATGTSEATNTSELHEFEAHCAAASSAAASIVEELSPSTSPSCSPRHPSHLQPDRRLKEDKKPAAGDAGFGGVRKAGTPGTSTINIQLPTSPKPQFRMLTGAQAPLTGKTKYNTESSLQMRPQQQQVLSNARTAAQHVVEQQLAAAAERLAISERVAASERAAMVERALTGGDRVAMPDRSPVSGLSRSLGGRMNQESDWEADHPAGANPSKAVEPPARHGSLQGPDRADGVVSSRQWRPSSACPASSQYVKPSIGYPVAAAGLPAYGIRKAKPTIRPQSGVLQARSRDSFYMGLRGEAIHRERMMVGRDQRWPAHASWRLNT
ncbi:hypothetical protein CYMTET_49686 [Cymbomonas tetramitiformis]|uniref:Uncharacterized protein n=1 Tax=Cymbomonas tetramitiformis TaxID=36881 RepID=A0AAE0EVJ2_9CHLO|nr:hypothetical protein CYMTET_49686 [Cymbomonas tetramitiformis]